MSDFDELRELINKAENIVFFGGAGVSTESGIPDFRGSRGLYTGITDEYEEKPEVMLSHKYLTGKPANFFSYYRRKMIYTNAEPNGAHLALAELERIGKLTAVITQNIDGLHQKAGNKNVIELHGSVLRNYCVRCGKKYPLSKIVDAHGIPCCDSCGSLVRPDVVLYGESLDGEAFDKAEEAIYGADVLIVGGTSLTVHPAASLVSLYSGEHLVIINKTRTPYDAFAEFVIREPIGEVLQNALQGII